MQLSLFEDKCISNYEEILLSLQECYFNKIVSGCKKNEYRFNFVKTKAKAYIYIPKNKQQVVGILYLGIPYWKDAKSSAKIYSDIGDGEYQVMYDWVKNKKGCYIIPIEKCVKFEKPISKDILKTIPDFIAPQTYLLLKNRSVLKNVLHNHELTEVNSYVK